MAMSMQELEVGQIRVSVENSRVHMVDLDLSPVEEVAGLGPHGQPVLQAGAIPLVARSTAHDSAIQSPVLLTSRPPIASLAPVPLGRLTNGAPRADWLVRASDSGTTRSGVDRANPLRSALPARCTNRAGGSLPVLRQPGGRHENWHATRPRTPLISRFANY
jgi:hypothetical protein